MTVEKIRQTAFQIYEIDNVATALCPLNIGKTIINGETSSDFIYALEPVPEGHKIAVRDIVRGEAILKYGVPIGTATDNITRGAWVHLHCMKSNYDERSNHLDLHTGVPTDTEY